MVEEKKVKEEVKEVEVKNKEKVIECINLEKKYFLFDKDYKVIPWLFTKKGCFEERTPLTNINLTINKGDVIGFIGKNGAGKSTLMKIIAGITAHTDGGLTVNGTVNSLINLGAGFNPKYTGRQNIYYKGLLMGMDRKQIDGIIDDIINFCELGTYFDLPLYMYSSGMSARLGFALAIFAEHDILIVDEVFAVGDKMFRQKSSQKMTELFKSGKSIIFASHSDDQIRQFCNRAIFIDDSRIVVDGTVDEALNAYNKKYAPNKVKKNASDFEDKFEKTNRFMDIVRSTVIVEHADLFREIGILHEYEEEYEKAYYFMALAKELRPKGKILIELFLEYQTKLEKQGLNTKLDLTEEVISKAVADFAGFKQYINNRNNPFSKVELYRELALSYELHGDIENALKYMGYAKELRPTGPFIIEKYDYYLTLVD